MTKANSCTDRDNRGREPGEAMCAQTGFESQRPRQASPDSYIAKAELIARLEALGNHSAPHKLDASKEAIWRQVCIQAAWALSDKSKGTIQGYRICRGKRRSKMGTWRRPASTALWNASLSFRCHKGTRMSIPKTDPRFTMADLEEEGRKFLEAGYRYWEAAHKAGISGAVIWLQDDEGKMIIFTRGEYRDALMQGIEEIGTPRHFGRVLDE